MKMLLKDGKRRVLTLSYDDGVVFDKKLIEILDKYGIKCTFNINTSREGGDGWSMTPSECIELYKNSPHEVAVHGYTHPFFNQISSQELIHEVLADRKNIERDYGVITRGLAYPYGAYNDDVVDTLAKCGIVYARTVNSTNSFGFPDDWLRLHPTAHHKAPNLMELAKDFVENEICAKWAPKMFYLWGHSYEFNNDNNWEVIEEFAEYIGGRDNIWYATNIEIYDYVTAYKRLERSYDDTIIHNPSATDVWFEINDTTYCIKGGETITL